MRPRLGFKNWPFWGHPASPPPRNASKSWTVLWKLHSWVAWAQGQGGQGHSAEESGRKVHTANQKNIWVQLSTGSPGQRGHGPHGANDHQHPQSSGFYRMSTTLPHQPTRDREETAYCARADEETPSEGARSKLCVPQQRLHEKRPPSSPLCWDGRCVALPWRRSQREHSLLDLGVISSQYSKTKQCLPLWIYPGHQCGQAFRFNAKERKEKKKQRKGQTGTPQVDIQRATRREKGRVMVNGC